jgi:ribonuclease P protein component
MLAMERLRRRGEFLAAAKGLRAPASAFVLQVRRRDDEGPARLGFTVSRKVGTAVERNRARRRLREMVRLSGAAGIEPGHDYVVVGRRAALTDPFDRLIADFGSALRRARKTARPPDNVKTGSAATEGAAGQRGGATPRTRTTR